MVCASCGAENRDGARFCDSCGAVLVEAERPREQRKTVTVLFCDVTGSTALGERVDPETLRATMGRYFDTARAAIERHGGTVEKFIGDAVMAVFGVPQVHEDDALRAVRAALELRDGVEVDVRIGVNTGEVVTGSADSLVTGDAVNVAARLEQGASPGEVLIGAGTYGLVRDAVEVELLPPLEARGKSRPVTAYRLLAVTADAPVARRFDAPLVGRLRESRLLLDGWERIRSERACALFTLLGAPGVGKSRLAAEFLHGLEDARVVRGRCLSYGEGITYWPVVEIVKQLLRGARPDDPAIAALLGDGQAAVDEIALAVRRLLESAAAEEPLVVFLDDVHWGEPAFLDLVEHVADWSRDAPILLLCLARPELLDRRPGWSGGKLNATTVLLEPLDADEAARLMDELLGSAGLDPALRARILRAAEGNPLFVEEMLAMVREGGDDLVVPPTIQALLAARIDQLPRAERAALERGAVEGEVFHRGAVQALAPDESQLGRQLMGLVRKELVRPSRSTLPGDDAFRFRHLLIRDAAYESLPKATRADLHERFAGWIEERGVDLVELDEILGYHLEQAARYRTELGAPDPALAARAAGYLGAAGTRAFERIDFHAAANLLERATSLLGPDDPRHVPLLATLAETVYGMNDLERTDALLEQAMERGQVLGERPAQIRASIFHAFLHGHLGEPLDQLETKLDGLVAELELLDDPANLARALITRGWVRFWRGRAADGQADGMRALEPAASAGEAGLEAEAAGLVVSAMRWGPAPWETLAGFVDERLAGGRSGVGGRLGSSMIEHRASADVAAGRFDAARDILQLHERSLEERGVELFRHTLAMASGRLELLAGEYGAAEGILRRAWDGLGEAGETGFRATVGAILAEALIRQGRHDEAAEVLDVCERIVAPDDLSGMSQILTGRAIVSLRTGRLNEALAHGRRAVEVVDRTDYLDQRVEARVLLGEALLAVPGGETEARALLEKAVALAEAKGSLVYRDRARALLAAAAQASRPG